MNAAQNVNRRHSQPMMWTQQTTQGYNWIHFITKALQPFSLYDNLVFRQYIKYEGILRRTITKHISNLKKVVEERCAFVLPDEFAIVFGGWSAIDTHDVVIFATFPNNRFCGYSTQLLSMSPIRDVGSQDSKSQNAFF